MNLFSQRGYDSHKRKSLRLLRHAIDQAEKDQWFNAIRAMSNAVLVGSIALQSLINRDSWIDDDSPH